MNNVENLEERRNGRVVKEKRERNKNKQKKKHWKVMRKEEDGGERERGE